MKCLPQIYQGNYFTRNFPILSDSCRCYEQLYLPSNRLCKRHFRQFLKRKNNFHVIVLIPCLWRFTSWYCFFAQKDQIEILAFNGAKTISLCSISSNARMPTNVRRVWLLEIGSIWNWEWNIIFRSEVVETECCGAKIFFDNDNVSFNLFVQRGRSHYFLDQIFSSVFVS